MLMDHAQARTAVHHIRFIANNWPFLRVSRIRDGESLAMRGGALNNFCEGE
jgi:hypothetical protein